VTVNDRNVALDPWRGVYNAIRESILNGDYAPGERLVEQQLADRFGTSRGPIRTALQELERAGLVDSIDRKGTFVRVLSDQDMDEIISLWMALWRLVIERLIPRIGPKEHAWFEAFKARMHEDASSEEMMSLSIDFARELIRMAQHRRMAEIFETLLVQSQARPFFLSEEQNAHWGERIAALETMWERIVAGDENAAAEASDVWIGDYKRWLVDHPLSDPDAANSGVTPK
jgi:DNA-binding GntR family transcriptional regulator